MRSSLKQARDGTSCLEALVWLLTQLLLETDTVIAASSFLSLKGRVARTMLELAEHFGQEVGPAGSSSVRRLARTISPLWPELRARK